MPDLIDMIKDKRDLSQSSIKLYTSQVKRLFGNFDPGLIKKDLKSPEKILEKIHSMFPSDNTRKSYINIAVVASKVLKMEEDIIEKYDKALSKIANDIYDQQKKQEVSKKNEGRILNKQKLDEVLQKTKKIAEIALKTFNKSKDEDPSDLEDFQDYLIVALYTLFPPRRNKDYVNMKVMNKQPEKIEEETNYLIGNKKRREFIFNAYKTRKTYGIQRFDVPQSLNLIFNQWLKMNKTGLLLIDVIDKRPMTANELTKTLNRIFKKHTGVKVSTTLLRKAYLTNKYGNEKTIREKEKDAKMMGHSREEASKSYIKPNAFEIEEDGENKIEDE